MSGTFAIHKLTEVNNDRHLHCLLARTSVFDNFSAESEAVPLSSDPIVTDRST